MFVFAFGPNKLFVFGLCKKKLYDSCKTLFFLFHTSADRETIMEIVLNKMFLDLLCLKKMLLLIYVKKFCLISYI